MAAERMMHERISTSSPQSHAHNVPPAASPVTPAGQSAIVLSGSMTVRPIDSSELNPDAGRHAITDDPRELDAALRAGVATWTAYPYYEHRYGERGRRFTRSDSAWIASLAAFPEKDVLGQVAWLGRVLASRGMPRLLLEEHLATLAAELTAAVPERRDKYDRLIIASGELRRQRHERIEEVTFNALASGFEARVGPNHSGGFAAMGPILVGAAADEACGITKAVHSVEEWATDPARFSSAWIREVRWTIAEARRAARAKSDR